MAELATRPAAARFLERVMRVPPEPHPPAGAGDSVRVFRSARGYYRYQLLKWWLKELFTAGGLVFGLSFVVALPDFPYRWLVEIVELFGVLAFIANIPFTYLLVKLDYEMRWYIVTDRSLRIRDGIVNVSEKTMSFANIQNISVRQGPLQRFFGIADVEVRTAGGGSGGGDKHEAGGRDMHLGYFRGVDNAEEIRDAILARVRRLRDTGLGDPDADHAEPHETDGAAHGVGTVEAARELLDEARALREAIDARPRALQPNGGPS